MAKWAICFSAWVLANVWVPAWAVEDNMFFSGTLVNESCLLAVEDEVIELDFKSVINKELYLNGRTLGRPISLHLNNCNPDIGQSMVSITFNGNESGEVPGLLVLEGAGVHGLLVGLETKGGKALPLNMNHRMGELTSGNNVLSFNAYLQGTPEALGNRSIGLGDFEASMIFALSYE